MPTPASSPTIIQDLIPKVAAYLQNRSDVSETQTNPEMRPSAWLRDTLKELTANYPFEHLCTAGPLVTIGPGLGWQGSNYAYPVSMFLNPGDDMTLSQDPVVFFASSQTPNTSRIVATTSNQIGYALDYVSVKAIQSLLFIPGGVPSKYTRYGDQFWFGSQPGTNYNMYLPYQIRHPFTESLPNSPVRVPSDWHDIVSIAAAQRGAVMLRWNDHATFLHNTLYGDPDFQRSGGVQGRPGLISGKLFQVERDKRLSPIQIMPGASRY
jgi:hypothetical protein